MEFHYKVLFLRFYIIYMPVVWISHVFHWYLWPCPLTARKFAKVTYGQRSLWRHLRSRKLTPNRGLSQEEKNDRNEAKTCWFSKPVSFNVECARPLKLRAGNFWAHSCYSRTPGLWVVLHVTKTLLVFTETLIHAWYKTNRRPADVYLSPDFSLAVRDLCCVVVIFSFDFQCCYF